MRPLTSRQAQVLRFIQEFAARRGFPPTYAEIAARFKFRSRNAAREHVRLLARKKALVVEPALARGLRVTAAPEMHLLPPRTDTRGAAMDRAPRPASLSVIGEVAAGQPILAEAHVERQVAVDPSLFQPRADFLLRVRGDSMIEAGIRPGDLVAVHRTPTARDGQIAVVRLDDDVTVKRLRTRRRAGQQEIVLEPANSRLAPIVVDPSRIAVAIEGLVVGLVRTDLGGSRLLSGRASP